MAKKNLEITEDIAKKVIKTVKTGLCDGKGEPIPGQMCVEAAVCYAMGLPHDDQPPCVHHNLRSLKIMINDRNWSGNDARAKGLVRMAVLQLGTNKNFNNKAFGVGLRLINKTMIMPMVVQHWLNLADYPEDNEETAIKNAIKLLKLNAAPALIRRGFTAFSNMYGYESGIHRMVGHGPHAGIQIQDMEYLIDYLELEGTAEGDRILNKILRAVEDLLIKMKVPGREWLPLIGKVRPFTDDDVAELEKFRYATGDNLCPWSPKKKAKANVA
jgi:hypothetical protein